ncbi:iqgap- protein [Yamadazyma tenuis]|uniref:Uncharacterized protein n=1 Tax=Candida tenuis (strain ATCC 10573 / BCRC 21748 / CBS 615 / JCM 9827 / NBRC 10315 / NRRL Y-1498 / VKM Y-70) TaxID=590646 RepID=G3AY27_CANTC|nr:uncharacterized protein CANTEDRAFT_92083 [Yamadazyma tenuis ATCC 10573]EGV65757.1 hypothetical protein CANTEDRAFT_92083 [Yamadazyma tenuis ATCC 10573]WEJ95924.1 iqgap- protein [Yamadazyma tenuis]
MSSPVKNIALKYLDSINDINDDISLRSPSKVPLQPSLRQNTKPTFNKSFPEEDLDKLARQLDVDPVSTPTKNALFRTKYQTPSVTVSSFKTPTTKSSTSSSKSGSPIKRHLAAFETPIKRSTEIPALKTDMTLSSKDKPYLSSPGNSTSTDSPGYEYLCRIEAIKNWLQQVMGEPIDKSAAEMISDIRNGIVLAKLANVILPTRKSVFTNPKLQFRHTENINRFFKLMDFLSVPDIFTFELTDLYDAKNVPKVWFCLHAMSYMLHKYNPEFPQIKSLVGRCEFCPEDIRTANRALVGAGLPNFSSADNNNDSTFDSIYMNRVINNSPTKLNVSSTFSRPSDTLSSPKKSDKFSDDPFNDKTSFRQPRTPDRSSPASARDEFYTPKSHSIRESMSDDVDYKDSRYYTPEIDDHLINIVKLQALSRGATFRYRMFVSKIMLRSYVDEFTHFNSIIRGNMARMRTIHRHRDEVLLFKHQIIDFQAISRSKLLRSKLTYDFNQHTDNVVRFQSIVRGSIVRQHVKSIKYNISMAEPSIIELQAQSKMLLVYPKVMTVLEQKALIEPSVVDFQSVARRLLYQRGKIVDLISNLKDCGGLINFQAVIRAKNLRNDFYGRIYVLQKVESKLTQLQSVARGGTVRTKLCNNVLITLMHEDVQMNSLFAKARGNMTRRSIGYTNAYLHHYEDEVVELQSRFRGLFMRFKRDVVLEDCYNNIGDIIALQSIIRGNVIRKEMNSIDSYYVKNMASVIKVQSHIKSNFAKRAYQSLITMRNPPLSIIRRFAYLLSDNDTDFEQELELAELKDRIIERSKANEELETLIENLDIKLGLLDKNKISIEDFIKNKFNHFKDIDEDVNIKNLEKLNKSSRERIECYQTLFYFLQTKPIYFVRLHESMELSIKETKEFKNLQKFIVLMYPIKDSSISHHSREEFFFMKLILSLMESDMKTHCSNLTDITKSSCCFWIDYFVHFNSHTYQRLHLKTMLGKTVMSVIDNDDLDFESDPSVINASLIDRDMRINGFSDRDVDASPQIAIKDPEVSNKFVENLMNLREYITSTLNILEAIVDKIPLHIRVVCSQAYKLSKLTYPDRSEMQHLAVAGVIFIKHYIQNIFQNPENFGFLANNSYNPGILKVKCKANLKALGRVMMQAFALKPFSDNFLKPLNEYLQSSVDLTRSIIVRLINVDDLETSYNLTDYDDIVTHDRPKLTMKVTDMAQIEKIIQNNIDMVAPSSDDQLYSVATQLNQAVNTAKDLVALTELGSLTLNLNPTTKEESIADTKGNALFTQVKRSVLYIIRVQEGDELLELLVAGITPDHERNFKEITHGERQVSQEANSGQKKKAYHKTSLGDLTKITYHDLKKNALETILQLEFMGLVHRNNSYQEILNQIAVDIKTKHSQRISRKSQLEIAIKTQEKLIEKERVLNRQHRDYNNHVESILSQLQSRPKDKKLFNIIPIFSKQYFYHRELKKSNRLPKFGSYKYSARKLIEQKVILDFAGALSARYNTSSKLDFMFSCHRVGIFTIEAASGSVSIPGAFASITLDELLNLQYESKDKYEVFDGMVVFDTMNLTSFVFKKFYDMKKE